jgi:hypothetical protein
MVRSGAVRAVGALPVTQHPQTAWRAGESMDWWGRVNPGGLVKAGRRPLVRQPHEPGHSPAPQWGKWPLEPASWWRLCC